MKNQSSEMKLKYVLPGSLQNEDKWTKKNFLKYVSFAICIRQYFGITYKAWKIN